MTTTDKRRSPVARAWVPALGGLAAIALAVAGCGGTSGGAHASGYGSLSQSKAAAAPAASGATTVRLASSKLGKILVDSKGETLYLFQADKGPASTCSGACASVWPPLRTTSTPIAGPGVSAAKLSTTKRSDGASEVTYNGHPLYTYLGDGAPGQTTGEGNQGFGAEWDVLSAAGNKIEIGS
jgi:predicted lipoprotein with Yx(FWY)xxD motif